MVHTTMLDLVWSHGPAHGGAAEPASGWGLLGLPIAELLSLFSAHGGAAEPAECVTMLDECWNSALELLLLLPPRALCCEDMVSSCECGNIGHH